MRDLDSEYFTLQEFLVSQTASRLKIDNTPSDVEIEHIEWLCKKILDPLRNKLGKKIIILSGYRNLQLNKAVGGTQVPISQHTEGKAADIIVPGMTPKQLMNFIINQTSLPFDQVILEFSSWIHISYDRDKLIQRNNKFKINTGTGYVPYIGE
jgi:hypothetical protein